MTNYIDADKLIAEIEKRAKFHDDAVKACTGLNSIAITHSAGWKEDTEILTVINSLQQEQSEVDLEKELDNYMDGYFSECQDGTLLNEGGSELQYEDVSKIAKYFYELGLNTRKEE